MGLYDTIILDKLYQCPACGTAIKSLQIKEFDLALLTYHIGDCVSSPGEVRIFRERLFCNSCRNFTGKDIYIAVNGGILVGTTDNLEEAKGLVACLSPDKILLMYHSLYKTHDRCHAARSGTLRLLADLYTWYTEDLQKKDKSYIASRVFFSESHFEGIDDPLEALRQLIAYEKLLFALDELQESRQTVLEVRYTEKVEEGKEAWSIAIHQDKLDELCGTEWTWSLVSKKKIELDPEKKGKRQLDNVIIVDEPFSRQVMINSIEEWLHARGYTFVVSLIE